jgi:8-oxo-dGTP pyrophosphatase MutT (NUDIX family)
MGGRAVTEWAPPIPKVTALITRPGPAGPELLVFEHRLTGVQLPSGTVEEGESFAMAAFREGWEETGALGLELVRDLAVTRRQYAGRGGAVVRDVVADGRSYPRGNHLNILRIDGDEAAAELWDGTPIELPTTLITRSEERHVFHLRATVEMPDEWLVVSPDGGGTDWWCFWATIDEAHGTAIHEYQRDWLDAARPLLDQSAQEAPPTRPRPRLPSEFGDAAVWEHFIAPPVDRRFALSYFDGCDEEACSRAHGLCVTHDGQVVLVKEGNGFWDLPGGGKESGESTAENFAREIWEEVCARVVDSRFLTALRIVELDEHGGPVGAIEHHAQMWARVELEPWEPQFEVTERKLVTPEDAVELSLHARTTLLLLERAAAFDPLLDWAPDPE